MLRPLARHSSGRSVDASSLRLGAQILLLHAWPFFLRHPRAGDHALRLHLAFPSMRHCFPCRPHGIFNFCLKPVCACVWKTCPQLSWQTFKAVPRFFQNPNKVVPQRTFPRLHAAKLCPGPGPTPSKPQSPKTPRTLQSVNPSKPQTLAHIALTRRANSQLCSFNPLAFPRGPIYECAEKLWCLGTATEKLHCVGKFLFQVAKFMRKDRPATPSRGRVPHRLSLKQCRNPSILGPGLNPFLFGVSLIPAPPRDARTSSRREDSGSRICTMWCLARRWTIAWLRHAAIKTCTCLLHALEIPRSQLQQDPGSMALICYCYGSEGFTS